MDDMARLLEGSPFGVSAARRSDGIIVFANKSFTRMLGVERDSYVGTRARDWFVDDAQRAGVIGQLKVSGAVEDAEVQFRKADGTPFWVIMTVRSGVFRGDDVNLAWAAEITERKQTEVMTRALLEGSPFGVSASRRSDGKIVFANRAFMDMLGVEKHRFIGTKARSWFVDEGQRSAVIRQLKQRGAVEAAEVEFRKADGTPFWVLITIRDDIFGGHSVNLAWIADITERKHWQQRLELAAKVVETANEGIVVTDAQRRIQAVNGAFTQITGYTAADVMGREPRLLASGRHPPDFFRDMWNEIERSNRWQGEVWNRRKDGGVYLEWLSIAAVRDGDGRVANYLGVFSDITSRKQYEELIWRQANFDSLTGLPNRMHFLSILAETIRRAEHNRSTFAVMFIDLDGFKEVNDLHGHAAGDLLLQLTAQRLSAALRSGDTVARLAGDEFAAIAEGVQTAEAACMIAEKLLSAVSPSFDLGGAIARVGASIGVARFPEAGRSGDALLKCADEAMYSVKRTGKNNVAVWPGAVPLP